MQKKLFADTYFVKITIWQKLLKIFVPILSALLLICICLTCVIQCVSKMTKKMIQSVLTDEYFLGNISDREDYKFVRKTTKAYDDTV